VRRHAMARGQDDGLQPEFAFAVARVHVNVWRLTSLIRIEIWKRRPKSRSTVGMISLAAPVCRTP
jgi:hypothetical protein